jgi:hypothetical protein
VDKLDGAGFLYDFFLKAGELGRDLPADVELLKGHTLLHKDVEITVELTQPIHSI